MIVEAIDDVDSTEEYIKDLEIEVATLRSQVLSLNKQLKHKPVVVSQEDYDRVCVLLQEAYKEIIPF